MKLLTVLSWTAVLCLISLYSCRASDEFPIPVKTLAAVPENNASFDGEIKDPPKDVPKDYDNWKLNH